MEGLAEIWTVGHSRYAMEEFIAVLRSHRIEAVADVRRFAVSRRHPHFNEMELFRALGKEGIDYNSFAELGGRRRPLPGSPNSLWRNESFRGYADFMMTADFERGIARLLEMASHKRTAVMCAELVWWRCHRALISDYLKVRGIKVTHIMGVDKSEEHPYTSAARIEEGKLSYSPAAAQLETALAH